MSSYEEKKAARIERTRQRAGKLAAEGAAKYQSGRARLERIPFGQPIHVGHHSERTDRNYRAKATGAMEKGFALTKEAERLAASADAAERSTAVSSDDPDAIVKLRAQLVEATARADAYAAGIKAARKVARPWTAASLAAAGVCAEAARFCVLMGGVPTTTNVRANVRRVAERIALLEAAAAAPLRAPETFGAIVVSEDREANRVRIEFPGRVSAEVYKLLGSRGFKHARSLGEHVWQRQTSGQAWYEARYVAQKASES